MDIHNRVKQALIGFSSLFEGSTIYSFDNIVSESIAYAMESEGFSSMPPDVDSQEQILYKSLMVALEPIESIVIMMPTRKRMEVGIETENADIKNSLAALRKSYESKYNEKLVKNNDTTTFVIKNAIESTKPIVIPFPSFLSEDE